MTLTLQGRLRDAKATLDRVRAALGRSPGRVPVEVETSFRALVNYRSDIDHWLTMLDARSAAWQLLDELEGKADSDGLVPLGSARAKFVHVRLIGT